MYIDCQSFHSLSSVVNTTKYKFIRYLCIVVVIHSCHHHLNMSSFRVKKNKSLNFGQSILKTLNTRSRKYFWSEGDSSNFEILHPFKYPGPGEMSLE